ncbi:MAG: pyruvate, phosphate dikinase [Chloroflexi bacterium]|nr:pyruvate, phosphate dikinase [Chloroflexota bacterium]
MPSIYGFTDGIEDKGQLGNKGANLVTMSKIGLAVPPAFIVSIDAYNEYKNSGKLPLEEIEQALKDLEEQTGKRLGDGLAVSVRSSAPASMPGMMDTILDVRNAMEVVSCIRKVFDSWDNLRAVEYRALHGIPSDMGTAAVVQSMVFGDLDERSGTGVMFTRNPNTGEKELFGEYLHRAKGEDLVSGRVTPKPINVLKSNMPEMHAQLQEVARILEEHFRDMQDVEFTIESDHLYILQTRSGKRSGQAEVKIAVDMAREGLLSRKDAIMRVYPSDVETMLHRRIKSPEKYTPIVRGPGCAPGAATGMVVFTPQDAVLGMQKNQQVVLVRPETSPDDIQGIAAAAAVVTSRGGLTSHAAIVTRAMGKPSICGAENVKIDIHAGEFRTNGHVVKKGDIITVDGNTGKIYFGALPLEDSEGTPELDELLGWASEFKRLGVRANAETVETIAAARKFGAEGIGLCRTERQFNAPERLSAIVAFIMAATEAERRESLKRLHQLQKKDFIAIFKELRGMPIIIRLLDLPLHEFLPSEEEVADLAVKKRIRDLTETNPMLGHRGVRLAITYPEIYQMQINAITEACAEVPADVSIMVPQVVTSQEFLWVKRMVRGNGVKLGVMMETVRACMRAGKLAEVADFFSFGTNDLTQATFSFSREDVEKKFLSTYIEKGILLDNPFQILDVNGVGRLMQTAASWAKEVKPSIEIGVCGEHAGEPRSIGFIHRMPIDYVSCSPFRIPIAKLAAAQAAISEEAPPVPEVPAVAAT